MHSEYICRSLSAGGVFMIMMQCVTTSTDVEHYYDSCGSTADITAVDMKELALSIIQRGTQHNYSS